LSHFAFAASTSTLRGDLNPKNPWKCPVGMGSRVSPCGEGWKAAIAARLADLEAAASGWSTRRADEGRTPAPTGPLRFHRVSVLVGRTGGTSTFEHRNAQIRPVAPRSRHCERTLRRLLISGSSVRSRGGPSSKAPTELECFPTLRFAGRAAP